MIGGWGTRTENIKNLVLEVSITNTEKIAKE